MDWQGPFAVALTLSTLITLIATRISPHLVMTGAMALLSDLIHEERDVGNCLKAIIL